MRLVGLLVTRVLGAVVLGTLLVAGLVRDHGLRGLALGSAIAWGGLVAAVLATLHERRTKPPLGA